MVFVVDAVVVEVETEVGVVVQTVLDMVFVANAVAFVVDV